MLLENKYRLERELGVGGMGQVFLARDTIIDRKVAIKLLHKSLAGDESVRRRFTTEAKAIARLRHPNCVMLYEFGISAELDALYAVFEFVDGQSLEKWVGQKIPIGDVLELGRQVCEGVEHAHGQKIIHRDLKPDNIMVVVTDDGDLEFKILDFGIARITEDDTSDENDRLTKMGQLFGTPPYMSPEQIKGKLNVTLSSDIYSIGVILYELLEGRLPFIADTPMETVIMHLNEEVPPMVREDVPESLREIVMRCLEKRPEDRYVSCKALGKAIQGVEWNPPKKDSLLNFQATKEASDEIGVLKTEVAFGGEPTEPEESYGAPLEEEFESEVTVLDHSLKTSSAADTDVDALKTSSATNPVGKAGLRNPGIDQRFGGGEPLSENRIATLPPKADRKKQILILLFLLVCLVTVVLGVLLLTSGESEELLAGAQVGTVEEEVLPDLLERGQQVDEDRVELIDEGAEDAERRREEESLEPEVAERPEPSVQEQPSQEERPASRVAQEPRRGESRPTASPEPQEASEPERPAALRPVRRRAEEEVTQEPEAPTGLSVSPELRRRGATQEGDSEDREEPASIRLRRN